MCQVLYQINFAPHNRGVYSAAKVFGTVHTISFFKSNERHER